MKKVTKRRFQMGIAAGLVGLRPQHRRESDSPSERALRDKISGIWPHLRDSVEIRYLTGDALDELFNRVGSDTTTWCWCLGDSLNSIRCVVDGDPAINDSITYHYDEYGDRTSVSGYEPGPQESEGHHG